MGSVKVSADKELTVLVTGFGPFREQYPVNPSWEITARLPDYLPADRAKDITTARRRSSSLPPVRIFKLGPVRVNYEVVRDLVPKIWDAAGKEEDSSGSAKNVNEKENENVKVDEIDDVLAFGRKFDFVIHIGMAGTEPHYDIERIGHRDGYGSLDVDGRFLGDDARHLREGDKWIWHGVPHVLQTDLDIDDVHRRWVERSPSGFDLRISNDAGRYLCDFIYFSSLAHLWKQGRERKVVFFHVPLHPDETSVQRGVELALNLIRSIAESEVEGKQQQQR